MKLLEQIGNVELAMRKNVLADRIMSIPRKFRSAASDIYTETLTDADRDWAERAEEVVNELRASLGRPEDQNSLHSKLDKLAVRLMT
jgi:hypothetical protein